MLARFKQPRTLPSGIVTCDLTECFANSLSYLKFLFVGIFVFFDDRIDANLLVVLFQGS